jgi:acyl transferase domain-containing protein
MTMSEEQRSSPPPPQASSEEQKAVAYLRRALVELNETRARLRKVEGRLTEPIAIVGMGCRYPGGVGSPEALWEVLADSRDVVSGLPRDRGWDLEALPPAVREDPSSTFKGGFIDSACDFDAEFFGIDDEEARMMDPQQRLLLETAWETCEYAGIDPVSLRGSDTGVFTGISMVTYSAWLFGAVAETPEGHYTLGTSGCMAAGRLAHMLKIEGPAVTLDTACSSSSVALHLACQALRQGECSMALAGGAAIIATPWMYLEVGRQDNPALAAADARCRSFADGAKGTALSEGVGMVLLERLSDARRLGHEVLAVVRGSAYNQDGASNGLTAPNGLAHEGVIRKALRNAEVSPDQVDAVEAHGMGTALGDPIEAQALLATYGRERAADRPLWLGSMKSNLGHTQSAGGVGGVIKMVMAMRNGLLPKTLHVDAPSRLIDWSSGAMSLLVEPMPWVRSGEPRRAAVHSFGMSGTNVHVILEEPAPLEVASPAGERQARLEGSSRAPVPWPISGRGEDGLQRQAQRLAEFLAERPELDIADVGRSLAARPALSHRAVPIGTNRAELLAAVERLAEGRAAAEAAAAHTGTAEAVGADEPASGKSEPAELASPEEPTSPAELASPEALASLAQAWTAGGAVDWEPVFAELDARPVRLPTYAFARRRYWVEHSPLWEGGGPIVQPASPAPAGSPPPVPPPPAPATVGPALAAAPIQEGVG